MSGALPAGKYISVQIYYNVASWRSCSGGCAIHLSDCSYMVPLPWTHSGSRSKTFPQSMYHVFSRTYQCQGLQAFLLRDLVKQVWHTLLAPCDVAPHSLRETSDSIAKTGFLSKRGLPLHQSRSALTILNKTLLLWAIAHDNLNTLTWIIISFYNNTCFLVLIV